MRGTAICSDGLLRARVASILGPARRPAMPHRGVVSSGGGSFRGRGRQHRGRLWAPRIRFSLNHYCLPRGIPSRQGPRPGGGRSASAFAGAAPWPRCPPWELCSSRWRSLAVGMRPARDSVPGPSFPSGDRSDAAIGSRAGHPRSSCPNSFRKLATGATVNSGSALERLPGASTIAVGTPVATKPVRTNTDRRPGGR